VRVRLGLDAGVSLELQESIVNHKLINRIQWIYVWITQQKSGSKRLGAAGKRFHTHVERECAKTLGNATGACLKQQFALT